MRNSLVAARSSSNASQSLVELGQGRTKRPMMRWTKQPSTSAASVVQATIRHVIGGRRLSFVSLKSGRTIPHVTCQSDGEMQGKDYGTRLPTTPDTS